LRDSVYISSIVDGDLTRLLYFNKFVILIRGERLIVHEITEIIIFLLLLVLLIIVFILSIVSISQEFPIVCSCGPGHFLENLRLLWHLVFKIVQNELFLSDFWILFRLIYSLIGFNRFLRGNLN
jgi:hypothetical protein